MRKHKLFAMLIAVLGVTTLKAQVGWTSKTNLLTNPSFETGEAISDLTTCGWGTDGATGWTITPASSSNAQVGVGNASSKIQGIGSTFSPSEGLNYFYTRNNWNADTEYTISQTISSDLPAGLYKLTCKTATYSSDAKLNTIELSLQEGDKTPVCQNGIVLSVWNTWGVILVKESGDTPLTIKARMKPGYSGSSKHYAMLLDDFQLDYISPEDFESASVDNPIDFSALINNSTIYNHTTKGNMPRGWTAYKHTTGNGNYTEKDKCDTRLEGWSGGNLDIDYYQTINNLPPGKYRVKALAHEASGDGRTNIYIYSDPNRAIGAVGQTEADYTTEPLPVLNGTANVGIISTAKDWVTADNFRIEYVGEDLSMYQAQYASAKTAAEEAIADGAYINVTGKERTDLQTAIDAVVEDTKAAYLLAITALETATAAFKAATSDYATLATEKEIAAGLGMTDESIASATATTKTGLVALQDLKVAEYNYVKDEFSYPVELPEGNWVAEGPTGSKSDQHWSGENKSYLEQSSAAWGQNAWSISYKQDKTLPAGDYVFKVSGRRAAGTGNTLSLVVTNINEPENPVELGMVNDFPEGDTGLGINKNGVTSFNANDEAGFANNNNGRGWQWRYVKFTLNSETTVQVAVKAEATTNHQWISFCDATLQMTEDTYLEANKGALDATTAAAEALIDTKPMGTAENDALKAALALPVRTGAELQKKIATLETAVAKANAWVADYNEAKAPLLALLEMFESKYNDGEDGCLYTVDEDSWKALIVAVAAANTAKDVNNDYSGFAAATESLKAAFVPVDASIMAYPTENKKSATASDMTNYYLVNASFDEGNTNGWVKTGSQTNNVVWSVTDGTFKATPSGSHYTGDAIWQEVTLPKGAYKLSVNVNAEEVEGHSSYLFASTSAPEWDNKINDLLASAVVEKYNEDVTLTSIFSLREDTTVYVGFNQTAGNRANTGIQGSYTIYDFTLTQAANQISTKDGVITVVGENEAADLAGIPSDENIVKVDLTGAIWSEASTLNINNKNSLVYVTDDANLTASNIVKVGVDEEGNTTREAKSIVLTEGYKFYAREAFTTATLNYAREFSANWLTVCLPFAYEIPENVKVETLGAVDLDTKTFTFNEVTGTMEANKPYIIKNSSETAALFAELGDVAVEATPEAMTIKVTADNSEHEAEFIGTYTAVKTDALMEDGVYDILFFGTDGQLYYLSQGTTEKVVNIKPFRAYIRLPKGAINWSDGQQAIARHGEGTTDIEDAELTNEGAPAIYDLMGRKVTSMEKDGMYIVNGKKVIVK